MLAILAGIFLWARLTRRDDWQSGAGSPDRSPADPLSRRQERVAADLILRMLEDRRLWRKANVEADFNQLYVEGLALGCDRAAIDNEILRASKDGRIEVANLVGNMEHGLLLAYALRLEGEVTSAEHLIAMTSGKFAALASRLGTEDPRIAWLLRAMDSPWDQMPAVLDATPRDVDRARRRAALAGL